MNWPEYLINACKGDNRKPNEKRMNVTHLFDAPLIRTLSIKYWDKIERKPEDMIWALWGTAVDTIVKSHNSTGMIDLKLELPYDDFIIVGKPDIYYPIDGLLVDVKTTSVWNLKEAKLAWTHQLNCYKYMMAKLMPQLKVNKMQVHGIARDWRPVEKLRYDDYPDCPFVILNIPVLDDIEQAIDMAIKEHKHNPERECLPDERWQKQDQYAVMKQGRKSALRVLNSDVEAKKWCIENEYIENWTTGKLKSGINIVKRPGVCTRCQSYCPTSSFCPFYKKNVNETN